MSEWTDRMLFCMQGDSDYFGLFPRASDGNSQYGPQLQGGLVAPNGFASGQHGISQGLIAAMNLSGIVSLGPGSPSGATRWGTIQSIVPWVWMYAAVGHNEPNAQLEVRRLTAMVLSRSTNRWNFIFQGARPSWYTGWNSNVNLLGSVAAEYAQPFFGGYQETLGSGNTAAYRPYGNIGLEAWAYPSAESPGIVPFSGAINPSLVQDGDGYLCAFQVRVIPVNPSLPINRTAVRFIAQMGYDFQGNTNGMYPWDYAHVSRNFIEGNNGRWVTVNPDGSWQWVMVVASGNLVPGNNGYRPPFAAAAGVADYSGDWPYNGAAYGGRGWTELTTTKIPIDLIAYYSEGGVTPPEEPPPTPVDTYVHPGAATLPVFGAKVVGGYKDFGPKNRSPSIAPTWTPSADAITIAAGTTATGTLIASGTPAPSYTKVSGPAWLTINSTTGALGGTVPAGAAVYSAVIRATNAAGATGSGGRADLALTITAVVSVAITTTTLPGGVAGSPYYQTVNVTGTGPFAWSVVSGAASLTAAGLTASGGAVFGADPIEATAAFTLRATDPAGNYDDQAFTIVIGAAGTGPTITTTSLAAGTVGTAYSAYVAATGQAPFAYSVIGGALAAGLSLSHVIDWDVALTGAALRTAISTPASYHAASQGWTIPGVAGARVTANVRSTIAWQKKSDGTYEVAPHNLMPGSHAITTANGWSLGPNLAENGLDGTLNGWPAYRFTSSNAGNSYIVRSISATAGQTYAMRWYVDSAAGSTFIRFLPSNRQLNVTRTLIATGVYECTLVAAAEAGETDLQFLTGIIDAVNGTVWRMSAPQVNFGSVLCPYVPTHGTAVYGPAIDWVANDGGAYEIRSEEARTNNIRNSSAALGAGLPTYFGFDNGGVGTSLTYIGRSTLLGMPAFDIRISGTPSANSYQALYFEEQAQIVASNGQTRTTSFFAQRTAGSSANITGFAAGMNENTAAGGYVAGSSASGTTIDGTARRYSHTRTFSGGGTIARVIPYLFFNVTSGQPIDITLRIACPQEELGATASSPILTYGAVATRGEDLPVIPDTSPTFISQTAGTMFAEFTAAPTNTVVNQLIADISDAGVTNRVALIHNTSGLGQFVVTVASTAVGDMSSAAGVSVGARNRIAGTFRANDGAMSMNGAAAVTDTSFATPTGLDRIVIGNRMIGGRALNGGVRSLYYRKAKHPAGNVVALSGGNPATHGDRALISGTPTLTGGNQLTVEAENDFGADTQVYDLRISPVAAAAGRSPWDQIIKVRRG